MGNTRLHAIQIISRPRGVRFLFSDENDVIKLIVTVCFNIFFCLLSVKLWVQYSTIIMICQAVAVFYAVLT